MALYPPVNEPITDRTGAVSRVWLAFFRSLVTDVTPIVAGAITGLTGDVTATGPGVVPATIPPDTVTYAQMQETASASVLLGRGDSGAGNPQEIAPDGTTVTITGTTLSAVGGSAGINQLTGDVTAGPGVGSQAATIPADTVTYAQMQNVSASSRLLGRGDSGSGDPQEITLGSGLSMTGTALSATGGGGTRTVGITIDGGGSAITTGVKGYLPACPFTGTITAATLIADQTGSIVIDVWKDTYANAPPDNADSITASAPPTLSSAQKSQDTTLTGWTTSVSAGDVFGFNVDSATTVTQVTLVLSVTES